MPSLPVKLTQCFFLAKHVVHYYFAHTDGDDKKRTSIENVQRIIERMTRKPVEKFEVEFEGVTVRGNLERYDDRFVIHVRAGQPEEWARFTVIKELCHALMDHVDEYSPDAAKTLRELVKWHGVAWDWETASEVAVCERLAELMALELIYPLEYRAADKEAVDANQTSRSKLAQERGVPAVWIERAHDPEHMSTCTELWSMIPEITIALPPPL